MKVFLMYSDKSSDAVQAAQKLRQTLQKRGIAVADSSSADTKKESDESSFLILLVQNTDEFNAFATQWRYFLNEIKWKRKKDGEVIVLAGDEADLRRVPFALKQCRTYSLNDLDFVSTLKEKSQSGLEQQDYAYLTAQKNENAQIEMAASLENSKEKMKADLEAGRQRLQQFKKTLDEGTRKSSESSDPSSRRYEGITRAGSNPPPNAYVQEKRNDEPFSEYQSPYQKKSSPDKSKNAGCGIAVFLTAVFFFLLIVILNQK